MHITHKPSRVNSLTVKPKETQVKCGGRLPAVQGPRDVLPQQFGEVLLRVAAVPMHLSDDLIFMVLRHERQGQAKEAEAPAGQDSHIPYSPLVMPVRWCVFKKMSNKQCPLFTSQPTSIPMLAWSSVPRTPATQPSSLRLGHVRGQQATASCPSQVGECPVHCLADLRVCAGSSVSRVRKPCSHWGLAHLLRVARCGGRRSRTAVAWLNGRAEVGPQPCWASVSLFAKQG